MYCPRCAAQNLDDAKYCRACGTGLESIALALSGGVQPPTSWQEQRKEAVASIIKGSGLLGLSLLIGVAMGLLSNLNDWIFVWMVFAGWMAVWGVLALSGGVTKMLNSRFEQRQAEGSQLPPFSANEAHQLKTGEVMGQPLIAPRSVTEQTTRSLNEVPREVETK